ncbi:histone H1-delta-like isoform X2 [Hydra vulgaris]|uniref:Histone H1-delta-like isoform X2 n=1 Tax=Hydra vulgaris TaxID=6087 RepID=A0ABM4B303_HYDVU
MSEVASPKKIAKKSAPKKPADHAPYKAMIVDAINSLKERKGSSRQAIAKHLKANNKVCDNVDSQMKINLKRMVIAVELVQVKGVGASGSFRIAAKPKAAKKKSPAATVKKANERKQRSKSTPKKKAAPTKKATAAKEKAKKLKEKGKEDASEKERPKAVGSEKTCCEESQSNSKEESRSEEDHHQSRKEISSACPFILNGYFHSHTSF